MTARAFRSHTRTVSEISLGSQVFRGLMKVFWAAQLDVSIRLNSGFTTVSYGWFATL